MAAAQSACARVCGPSCLRSSAPRYLFSVLTTGIVGRVHVGECERPDPMHLHDCWTFGPREMVHAVRHRHEPAWLQQLTFGRIELITHACAESAAQHRYVLIGGMPVRWDLVAVRHLQSERVR